MGKEGGLRQTEFWQLLENSKELLGKFLVIDSQLLQIVKQLLK